MLELSWTDAMLTLRWWSRNTEIVFFVDFKLVSLLAIPLSCFARWFSYMSLLVVAPRSAAPVVLGHPARSLQQNACLQQLFFLMFYVSITRSFFFDDSNRTSIFLESKNTCELVSRSSSNFCHAAASLSISLFVNMDLIRGHGSLLKWGVLRRKNPKVENTNAVQILKIRCVWTPLIAHSSSFRFQPEPNVPFFNKWDNKSSPFL